MTEKPGPKKKLSTLIKGEKKIVSMTPGAITLRPKRTRTVELNTGGFATIEDPAVRYECLGEKRNSMTGPPLDPTVPKDALVLSLFEELLENCPWMAEDVRYSIKILGEHEARQPWPGYDQQTASEAKATYENMPEAAKPNIFHSMKYEMSRSRYDEDLDDEISTTDDDKVKMWDDLYKVVSKEAKAESTDTVDLA